MLMLKSSFVLLKLNSVDVDFTSNYYLEYWHFFKMTLKQSNANLENRDHQYKRFVTWSHALSHLCRWLL